MVVNLFRIGSNRDFLISVPLSPMSIPHLHPDFEQMVTNSGRLDSELLPNGGR
jgi:hypothetical protein